MTLQIDHRAPIDYDRHREIAARLRAEMMNDIASKRLSAMALSRRTSLAIILALLLGAGGFWTVMPREPRISAAQAVPSTPAQASSR